MDQSESPTPVTRYAYLPSSEAPPAVIAEVRSVLHDDDSWFGGPYATVLSVQSLLTGELLPDHVFCNSRRVIPPALMFETPKACLEAYLQSLEDGRAQLMEQIKALDSEIDKLEDHIDLTKKALESLPSGWLDFEP